MTPIEELPVRHDDQYCLAALAARAREFLAAQPWCRSVRRGWLDVGWDRILGVFRFEFDPAPGVPDETVWVITGDLPPAYICNDNPNGASALQGYVFEMRRWVEAVRAGRPVDGLIPVNVEPTREYAEMLASRLGFIERNILASLASGIDERPVVGDE